MKSCKELKNEVPSPESFCHCWACAVSSYSPQAAQHPDDVAVHCSSDLVKVKHQHDQTSTSQMNPAGMRCLQLCSRGPERWSLWLQQCSVPLQAAASGGSPPCRASFPAAPTPPGTEQLQHPEESTSTGLQLSFYSNSHLLSSFMEPLSSGVVAKSRPHLVDFLCGNEIITLQGPDKTSGDWM